MLVGLAVLAWRYQRRYVREKPQWFYAALGTSLLAAIGVNALQVGQLGGDVLNFYAGAQEQAHYVSHALANPWAWLTAPTGEHWLRAIGVPLETAPHLAAGDNLAYWTMFRLAAACKLVGFNSFWGASLLVCGGVFAAKWRFFQLLVGYFPAKGGAIAGVLFAWPGGLYIGSGLLKEAFLLLGTLELLRLLCHPWPYGAAGKRWAAVWAAFLVGLLLLVKWYFFLALAPFLLLGLGVRVWRAFPGYRSAFGALVGVGIAVFVVLVPLKQMLRFAVLHRGVMQKSESVQQWGDVPEAIDWAGFIVQGFTKGFLPFIPQDSLKLHEWVISLENLLLWGLVGLWLARYRWVQLKAAWAKVPALILLPPFAGVYTVLVAYAAPVQGALWRYRSVGWLLLLLGGVLSLGAPRWGRLTAAKGRFRSRFFRGAAPKPAARRRR